MQTNTHKDQQNDMTFSIKNGRFELLQNKLQNTPLQQQAKASQQPVHKRTLKRELKPIFKTLT
jgi:ActR/RegA family two-component response regulator